MLHKMFTNHIYFYFSGATTYVWWPPWRAISNKSCASSHRMNTCCNKLSINECGMIRQVFVVWFNSGGDDASYHGLDSSLCRINPIRSIDGSSPPTFLFYYCPPWNFQSKVTKCHVVYTITIQWKPVVHIHTHLTYCLPTGQLYVEWKMFTFMA